MQIRILLLTLLLFTLGATVSKDVKPTNIETFAQKCNFKSSKKLRLCGVQGGANTKDCFAINYRGRAGEFDVMYVQVAVNSVKKENGRIIYSSAPFMVNCQVPGFDSKNCPILFKRYCPATWASSFPLFKLRGAKLREAQRVKGSDKTEPEIDGDF